MMVQAARNTRMSVTSGTSPLQALCDKRRITEADVAALRASDTGLGLLSRGEAELMFAFERNCAQKCRAWGEFLIEAVTDLLVWDERPIGVLTEEAALWLSDQVGDLPTPACLALLVSILEDTHSVPSWFAPAVQLRASRVFGRQASACEHRPD